MFTHNKFLHQPVPLIKENYGETFGRFPSPTKFETFCERLSKENSANPWKLEEERNYSLNQWILNPLGCLGVISCRQIVRVVNNLERGWSYRNKFISILDAVLFVFCGFAVPVLRHQAMAGINSICSIVYLSGVSHYSFLFVTFSFNQQRQFVGSGSNICIGVAFCLADYLACLYFGIAYAL